MTNAFEYLVFLCRTGQQPKFGFPRSDGTLRRSATDDESGTFQLFGGRALDIFDEKQLNDGADSMETWEKCEQYALLMGASFAPRNYFDKMILWTNQGKVWKFPIDNEAGKYV